MGTAHCANMELQACQAVNSKSRYICKHQYLTGTGAQSKSSCLYPQMTFCLLNVWFFQVDALPIANGCFCDLFAQFMSNNVGLGQNPGSLVDIVEYLLHDILLFSIYSRSIYYVSWKFFIHISMASGSPFLLRKTMVPGAAPLQTRNPALIDPQSDRSGHPQATKHILSTGGLCETRVIGLVLLEKLIWNHLFLLFLLENYSHVLSLYDRSFT